MTGLFSGTLLFLRSFERSKVSYDKVIGTELLKGGEIDAELSRHEGG